MAASNALTAKCYSSYIDANIYPDQAALEELATYTKNMGALELPDSGR